MDALLASTIDIYEDVAKQSEWQMELAFTEPRHTEPITGLQTPEESWRLKERMKTVSVALVLCLNVGVDPPDIVKTQPCAKLECWFDPSSVTPQKAIENIGINLEKQYERWQSKARYKKCLDPTVEEVKKLCMSLRRNAKEDRVLFHYNGHGVPKPTTNGEIWVFNKNYTQYIPLAIYDLQQWMGTPSIYVFDCSCAGLIVDSFQMVDSSNGLMIPTTNQTNNNPLGAPKSSKFGGCIQLASCGKDQILPMNPDLPADLFTSCLTTPLKMALRWFIQQSHDKLLSRVTLDMLDKIPGSLHDRRTMVGELNWIFTAITDTIAWDVLPRELFQRLFRQDLLVASLFRNFLLAERIMRTYNCTPISHPKIPSTHHHPMWRAWDMVVDLCLSQLSDILEERATFKSSTFFAEQLTAFEVWLDLDHSSKSHPGQLPIVLQVLLSPVHRLRALDLLARFLNLGVWAVNSALSVGIFPYVLKLLQSSAREVRPFLVSIWCKILAIDRRCQIDLVREGYHKYFLSILSDLAYDSHYRIQTAFVMSCVVRDFRQGQECAFQSNLIAICLEQINDPDPLLRRWLAICLGCSWDNYEDARWCGVRDSAHEKLFTLLTDSVPEVRAAAIYALETFINSSSERSDHANTIDHSIGLKLVSTSLYDSSVLVRHELVVALQYLVMAFESNFINLECSACLEQETATLNKTRKEDDLGISGCTPPSILSRNHFLSPSSSSRTSYNGVVNLMPINNIPRVNSLNALAGNLPSSVGQFKIVSNVYQIIWKAMYTLASDPHPKIASAATAIIDDIKSRFLSNHLANSNESLKEVCSPKSDPSMSEPSSPQGASGDHGANFTISERSSSTHTSYITKSVSVIMSRNSKADAEQSERRSNQSNRPLITTDFVDWSARSFCCRQPSRADSHEQTEWRILKNIALKNLSLQGLQLVDPSRFDQSQVMIQKCHYVPNLIQFHPYDPIMIIAGRDQFSVIKRHSSLATASHRVLGTQFINSTNTSNNGISSRITSLQLINAHENTLVATGSNDGCVRIYSKCYGYGESGPTDTFSPQLISAFYMLPDLPMQRKGQGMVLLWEQQYCQFIASGEHGNCIKIWDSHSEMRHRSDIPTGADYGITCLSSDGEHSLAAGFQDGSIRIYDVRIRGAESRAFTFRKHTSSILNCHLFGPQQEKHINLISGDISGEVRFWDKRAPSSVKKLETGGNKMSAMSVHPNADIFACGLSSQEIKLYNLDGTSKAGCIIRSHENLFFASSQKMSKINCLAFHPLKVRIIMDRF